jgi:hypothetical protein
LLLLLFVLLVLFEDLRPSQARAGREWSNANHHTERTWTPKYTGGQSEQSHEAFFFSQVSMLVVKCTFKTEHRKHSYRDDMRMSWRKLYTGASPLVRWPLTL